MVLVALLLAPAGALAATVGGSGGDDGGSRALAGVEPGLEYVAISPSGLARHLGALVEWKADRGVPSQVFTLEGIVAQYPGRDDAERVHNFLQDLYFNVTYGSLRWLLLVGDPEVMPVRYLWADRDHSGRRTAPQNLYLGDMYFSCLGSDWDLDGDGVYGEPGEEDPTPELYVGRIAATLPTEVEAAVDKTLAYELDPPGGDWYSNAFLAGALMDEPNVPDDPFTLPRVGGWSDEGFDPFSDNAWEVTQEVRRVLGEGWDYVDLADYPMFDGGKYSYKIDNLSRESAAAAWYRGNALVFWASHGYEGEGALAEYSGDGYEGMFEAARPFITHEDVTDPITGGILPLVYVSACYVGQFDKEDSKSFEGMLTVPEGGAIALIAGDGDTFRLENISTESYGNWWLSKRFFELVVVEGVDRPGQALGELKREYHEYYMTEGPPAADTVDMDYFYSNLYAYNLQGDPEVPLWLGGAEPARLAMEVVRGAVANSSAVVVRVTDQGTGVPVEGVRVFARGAGLARQLSALTGPDGFAVLSPGPTELGGELRLAATRAGCVSARAQVQVALGVRDLRVQREDVSGPAYFEVLGESLAYEVTVHNLGDFSATSVPVRFDSGDTSAPDEGPDARVQTRLVDLPPRGSETVGFTHRYQAPGQFTIVVEVDPSNSYPEADEGNNLASVQLVHRAPPSVPDQIGPFELRAGQVHPDPIDLDAYVTMPPGTPRKVSFAVVRATEGIGVWIDSSDVLQLRPSATVAGSATVTVALVVDGKAVDEMRVLLLVTGSNRPPRLVLPARAEVTVGGGPLEVIVNSSDPDEDPVTLATDLLGATIDGPRLLWTPAARDVGSRVVRVTATDGRGGTTNASVLVIVRVQNRPPEFLEDGTLRLEVEGDAAVEVALAAVDPDADPLEYRLMGIYEGFRVDPVTGLLTFDSSGLESGRHTAVVAVTDGSTIATRTVEVRVDRASDAPVVALIAVGFILLCAVGASVMFRRG